ncbi:MAG TPA: uracil-DNA glycosylase family protein [Chitinophagaceae bacterium]|nr:uracil-DNA glycosylase family protein [Chitinophagaceae bacterium]
MLLADHIISFLKQLHLDVSLPHEIEVMNPFKDQATKEVCAEFYKKYYNDNTQRKMIIGINPGRFGAGITGVPFTDPIRLQKECGIENPWAPKQELSSVFVYDVIKAFGGVVKFYKRFYITAVSPLGFTRHGKNLNYYDDKELQSGIKEFVVDCMNKQLEFGVDRKAAFCFGDGKNYKYLSKLNQEKKFFETIIPLSHPRFIMQYKLKKKDEYIQHYLKEFKSNA